MTRGVVLGTLVALGALSLAVSGQAPPAGPTAKAIAATKIEKVKDNLYIVTGSGIEDTNAFSGGNTAVFITDAGVTLVDTKLPGYGQTILDRVKTVTNKPIVRIINTHTHGDHTGGNEFFGANVESIVQENTKTNMARMDEFKGAKAQFLPKRTYKDRLTLGAGKDQIDLYYFGPGHTNGDTFVVFTGLQDDARRRHVRVEGAALHRPGERRQHRRAAEDACESGGRRQERGHHHQRSHSRGQLQRSEGICRVHAGFRDVRRKRGQGRQDRGPGGGPVQGAGEIQRLRR